MPRIQLTRLLPIVPAMLGLIFITGATAKDDISRRELTELGTELWDSQSTEFVQCPVSEDDPDTFALCATATCWMLDDVAYCKCDVLEQKSISLIFSFENDTKDVCDLLLAGIGNGFTVSTYATPRQLQQNYKPVQEGLGPPLAQYTCTPNSTAGYSAQCDGGLCFTSTQGKEFPGFGQLEDREIICSCPTAESLPRIGFQIAGPWSCAPGDRNLDGRCCDRDFHDKLCFVDSISQTGTEIAVGADTGSASVLSKQLDGAIPKVNQCVFRIVTP